MAYGVVQRGPALRTVGPDTGGWSIENYLRALFSPLGFAAEQTGQDGIGAPIGFYVGSAVVALLMLLASGLLAALSLGARPHAALGSMGATPVDKGSAFIGALTTFGVVVLISLVFVAIASALLHVGVLLARGSGGYPATFRAVTYSLAPGGPIVAIWFYIMLSTRSPDAAKLFWVGIAWSCLILVAGMKEMHALDFGRALGVGLAPMVVTFGGLWLARLAFMSLLGFGPRPGDPEWRPPQMPAFVEPPHGPHGWVKVHVKETRNGKTREYDQMRYFP